MAESGPNWDQSNFKPDLTDKQLPSIRIRTNRLQVIDVTQSLAISAVPVFVRNLRIKAELGNKGIIYIGASVSSDLRNNGYPLSAGDELPLEVNDLSLVFYQGDVVSDGLRLIYGS